MLPDDFVDPGDDFLELVAPEAGLDNDDPRMLGVRRDQLAGEQGRTRSGGNVATTTREPAHPR